MKYVILGHENPDVDSIISGYLLEKIMKYKGYDAEYIIPDNEVAIETIEILRKYNFDITKYQKELYKADYYVLVDHHEMRFEGNVGAIIDHHPTIKDYSSIPYYRNELASSTASIIAIENENLLDKLDIQLACLATLVDTVSFNSTKKRYSDVEWVKSMCLKYNFKYEKLYKDGLSLTNMTNLEKAYLNGLKKYTFSSFIVHSSYIQIEDYDSNRDNIEKCLKLLKEYIEKNKVDLFVFIVYDMTCFYTKVFKINKNDVLCSDYSVYASRGNMIIPEVEREFCKE